MTEAFEGSFADVAADEPYPGVARRTVDTAAATVNRYDFEPRAAFPRHHHPQEQITLVLRGSVVLTVGDRKKYLAVGDYSVVPPDVEHGISAGERGASFVAMIIPARAGANAYTVVEEAP
jgi:quercetin dioxygenase-like cupin family protein